MQIAFDEPLVDKPERISSAPKPPNKVTVDEYNEVFTFWVGRSIPRLVLEKRLGRRPSS